MQVEIRENVDSKSRVVKRGEVEYLKCSNCNKNLLGVYCSGGADTYFLICVDCPFCLDKSFDYEVKGMFHYVPVDNVQLLDIKTDDAKNRITIQTKEKV